MVVGKRKLPGQAGLRELKKKRTRENIVRVAIGLFAEHGFRATTLVDIAAAAEIAPSTLHAYFPTKSDIIFSHHAAVLDNARRRLLARPQGTSTLEALDEWVTVDLPALADSYAVAISLRRPIIDTDEELLAQERLRLALLEDVVAEAFARDLGESADDLRSRLMAAIAVAGLQAMSVWSYRHQLGASFDPQEQYALDHVYLIEALAAAEAVVERMPRPDLAGSGFRPEGLRDLRDRESRALKVVNLEPGDADELTPAGV
jgi:AcrR family transcriptional regulator